MTRRRAILFFLCLLLAVFAGVGKWMLNTHPSNSTGTSATTDLRIGWQTAWAVQGEWTQALKHTDILKQNDLTASFSPFAAGMPMVEAALAGKLDVVSAGAPPILQLIAKDSEWVIVARHAYNRYAVLVPIDSAITTLADLKGKKIGMPLGSTTEKFFALQTQAIGLKPSDFEVVNLGIEEQGEYVRTGTTSRWGEIEAVVAWEPTVTLFEDEKLARSVASAVDINLMAMRRKFLVDNPKAAKGFSQSTRQAWYFYSLHKKDMISRFIKETSLPLKESLLEKIAKLEPNANAESLDQVDVHLDSKMLSDIQATCDLLFEKKILNSKLNVSEIVVDLP